LKNYVFSRQKKGAARPFKGYTDAFMIVIAFFKNGKNRRAGFCQPYVTSVKQKILWHRREKMSSGQTALRRAGTKPN
jgi:hypothetical protein